MERLFAPIESRPWAAALARDLGKALVAVAVIQVTVAGWHDRTALARAVAYAIAGTLLWLTPTRLGAALALLTAAVSAATTVVGHVGVDRPPGEAGILLDLAALWVGGRALVATIAFHRRGRAREAGTGDEPAS